MHYQEKLDKLFANGRLWKHRTFRTVFDPYSSEYDETTITQKVEFLGKCVYSGISLSVLIEGYKEFYVEENKQGVINSLEDGLIRIITETLIQKNE